MAFNFSNTKTELSKFMDKEHPTFVGFPESTDIAAIKWANAINEGAKSVIPISITSEKAKQESEDIMKTLFKINGRVGLISGFSTYANILGAGMQPNFSATPPSIPITFDPVYIIGLSGGSNATCIDMMIEIMKLWFSLGVAVNNSSGTILNWT